MKGLLGMLLGENPQAAYDPSKFTTPRTAVPLASTAPQRAEGAGGFAARTAPKTLAPPPPPTPTRAVYGNSGGHQELTNAAAAQSEPHSLGCWLVSQPGSLYPVRQQLKQDTIPLAARVQIAACNAPLNCRGTAALYEPESFMNPIETTQPVIATGSLLNTYTGEVTELFEDAMPPPDNGRDAGDAVRERKQAQRRLMAAEGNVNASHRKREQQDPIQPGDAGVATQLANFQISADVATEWNERANRDLFFNRNELVPTELEMTRNPFGFEGYNNRLRINPYLLPTQELDEKEWTSNATLLPGGDQRAPKVTAKLRKERPRTDYLGQMCSEQPGADVRSKVRRSNAARDEEGLTEHGRCVNAQATYGEAAPVHAGQRQLSARDSLDAKTSSARGGLAPQLQGLGAVTAASLMATLHGTLRGDGSAPTPCGGMDAGLVAAGVGGERSRRQRDANFVEPASLFSTLSGPEGVGLVASQRQNLGSRDAQAAPRQGGMQSEMAAARAATSEAHASGGQQLLSDRRGAVRAPHGAGMASAQASEGKSRREGLDSLGCRETMESALPAAMGVHGGFGELRLRDVRPEGAEERSAGRPHLEFGGTERNSRVSASNARGRVNSSREDNLKVGGDADFQMRAQRGSRESKPEQLTRPSVRRSAAADGERCALPAARESRPVRAAKSPFRAHALKEVTGIGRLLPETSESRFDDEGP